MPPESGLSLKPLDTPIPGVALSLWRGWLGAAESALLQRALADQLPWSQHQVRLFGRSLPSPRLCCWIGDADAVYRYSGVSHPPLPWTAALTALRERLQDVCAMPFNSVLANLYRDGRDSMGWHADDEPELGARPMIASVSLGTTRRMLFRARRAMQRFELPLGNGDLLLMRDDTQRHAQHCVPKTRRPCGQRINLTFRQIDSTLAMQRSS